jgi:hypothetical protein
MGAKRKRKKKKSRLVLKQYLATTFLLVLIKLKNENKIINRLSLTKIKQFSLAISYKTIIQLVFAIFSFSLS